MILMIEACRLADCNDWWLKAISGLDRGDLLTFSLSPKMLSQMIHVSLSLYHSLSVLVNLVSRI